MLNPGRSVIREATKWQDYWDYYYTNIHSRYKVKRETFFKIYSLLTKKMGSELAENGYLRLPGSMGSIWIYISDPRAAFVTKEGKFIRPRVDWYQTMALWKEDPEAKANKIYIRKTEPAVKVSYGDQRFRGGGLVSFRVKRSVMRQIRENMKQGKKYPKRKSLCPKSILA